MAPRSVIIGTAGHIDHGKTMLVKALTGIDADRLEEEKRRGITIDVGFAHMELRGELRGESPGVNTETIRFGFVDVPGHERFVRNMLAGIGGIDLVLLIVAADEGVKPQTREHFEICKLLGISRGITVLTKTDKVSGARLPSVRKEAEALVHGSFLDAARAPIVAVSAVNGAGLEELKQALLQVAAQVPLRRAASHTRLPIDRVFTMKGFGTVVTGTLVSGTAGIGDELELLPSEARVRVRGVQVHNSQAGAAHAGERTALNLAGVEKSGLARGMTLVSPGVFRATRLIDAHLQLLAGAPQPKAGIRFHLHSFTAETLATVHSFDPGRSLVRLLLADPLLLLPGDRFIIRRFSPVTTIGGGAVLDAAPLKKMSAEARSSFLETLDAGDLRSQVFARAERRGRDGISLADLVAETGSTKTEIRSAADSLGAEERLVCLNSHFITHSLFEAAQRQLVDQVGAFHAAEPLAPGIARERLRECVHLKPEVFTTAVARLVESKRLEETADIIRLPGRAVTLKDDEAQARATIEDAFASAGLKVPAMKDVLAPLPLDGARAHKIVTLLLREGTLVKLGDDLVFHASALQSLRQAMRDYKSKSPTIDVASFKELTAVSRKYAIPLLEFLDRERITRRQGEVRIIL